MRRLGWHLTLVYLAACGYDYRVGNTYVYIEHGAEPWPDFPDVLDRVNSDVAIFFYPRGWPIPGRVEPSGCTYSQGVIRIRPLEPSTFEGCYAHELAHHTGSLAHDEAWEAEMNRYLEEICPHSWAYEGDCE